MEMICTFLKFQILAIVVLLTTSSSFAATTGSITVSGVIPAATAIVITPQSTYSALPLSTTQVNTQVATVREINNTTLGYTVTVASSNAGQLKNGTLGSIAYTARYNGVSFTLSTTPVQVTNQGPQTSVINVVKPLTISYTGVVSDSVMAGTYTDTLTFTIASN